MADFILFLTENLYELEYFGVFLSVFLEYACFPISSEILLPFLGALIYGGKMNLFLSVFLSSIGAVLGCSICFLAGRLQKKALYKLCGKHNSLKEGIRKAGEKFDIYGDFSVFVLRFVPIVRTYISFPAGMSKMSYKRFTLFSFCGAFVWNSILMSAGFLLGEYWQIVTEFMKEFKNFFNVFIVFGIIFIFFKLIRNR